VEEGAECLQALDCPGEVVEVEPRLIVEVAGEQDW
jgi:hypothetical protein